MTKILKDFRDFLMQGNLITLAVAFVMGTAFAAVLKSFVDNIVTPLLGAIFGKTDFSGLTFTIHNSVFGYGALISAIITFVSIAAAVFFFVVRPYEAIKARRSPEEEAAVDDDERRHLELVEAIRGIRA